MCQGGVRLLPASCQSWGHFLRVWSHGSALYGRGGGFFDSGSAVRKQTRTWVGAGDYFFPPSPRCSLDLCNRALLIPCVVFPRIWRLRTGLFIARYMSSFGLLFKKCTLLQLQLRVCVCVWGNVCGGALRRLEPGNCACVHKWVAAEPDLHTIFYRQLAHECIVVGLEHHCYCMGGG